jgi:hypothetical protein
MIARPRWTIDNRKITYALTGKTYTVPKKWPQELVDALGQLSIDYVDLGNKAADLDADLKTRTREVAGWRMQFEDLLEKVGAAEDKNPTRLLVILQKDLETALNLCSRLIYAVGAQPGGTLYESVNALMAKYNMVLTPNKGLNDIRSPYVEVAEHAGEGVQDVDIPDIATVHVNLDTGKLDITPVESPEAEMAWDNEGGNGSNREWLR